MEIEKNEDINCILNSMTCRERWEMKKRFKKKGVKLDTRITNDTN